jgi:integrase
MQLTVKDLLKRVHQDYKNNGHSSIRAMEASMNNLVSHIVCDKDGNPVHQFGDFIAENMKQGDLMDYVSDRRAAAAAAATILHELSILRRGYTLCSDEVARMPKFPRIKINNARKGFVDADEYERMKANADAPDAKSKRHYIWPYIIAYATGMRRGELFPLRRDAFDPERRIIRLALTKNGDGRVIGLAGDALEAALAALEYSIDKKSYYLFCERNGAMICRSTYNLWFRPAVIAADAPANRMFHDLRRTAVRNGINAGVDRHRVMEMTGHRSDKVFDRYDIIVESEMLVVAEQIQQAARLRKVNAEIAEKKSPQQPDIHGFSPTVAPIGNERQGNKGILDKLRAKLTKGWD